MECELSITYPKFLTKQSLRNSASHALTTGSLLLRSYTTEKPLTPCPPSTDVLRNAVTKLRLKVPNAKERSTQANPPTRLQWESSSTDLSFENYIASNLTARSAPEDLCTALLLLIAPPQSRKFGGKSNSSFTEFVGSTAFSHYSGNAFIRVRYRGRDIGKLGSDVSNCLAVLLALDLAFVHVRLKEAPEKLELGTPVKIEMYVYLSANIFDQSAYAEMLRSEAQSVLRNAVMGLFSRVMHWQPCKPSMLWSLMATRSSDVAIDNSGLLSAGASLDRGAISTSSEEEGPTPKDSLSDEEELDEEELEDSNELARRNNEVFGTGHIARTEYQLKTVASSVFASDLRKYQRIAFAWMFRREDGSDQVGPQSMWDEFLTPAGDSIYVNHMSGEIQKDVPTLRNSCMGGILADEMGLGKTVEMLSVVSSDIDPVTYKRQRTDAEEGGTLIVMPLTLIDQWTREIDKHFHADRIGLTVYQFHASERTKSVQILKTVDFVLTTYGTVLSEAGNIKASPLYAVTWRRIILDEAHYIKSRTTRTARAIFALKGRRRWCLTGTPIQNTLDDVFSLLHFLKFEPWGHWSWWSKLTASDKETNVIKRVQTVTAGLLLRRTIKTIDPETHQSIISLPPKLVVSLWIDFSEEERELYTTLFGKALKEFNQYVTEGHVARNYTSVLQLLLRLRQACCHPMLIYSGAKDVEALGNISSGSDLDGVVKQLLKSLSRVKDGEAAAAAASESEAFLRKQIRKFAPKGTSTLTTDSERATDAEVCPICLDAPELPVLAHCGHVMCRECAYRSLKYSTTVTASGVKASSAPRHRTKMAACPVCRTQFTALSLKPIGERMEESGSMIQRLCFDEDGHFNFSVKLKCLDSILRRILPLGFKAVVFSQWVTYLDIIQEMLKWREISYCRLDGSQLAEKRRLEVEAFAAPIPSPSIPPDLSQILERSESTLIIHRPDFETSDGGQTLESTCDERTKAARGEKYRTGNLRTGADASGEETFRNGSTPVDGNDLRSQIGGVRQGNVDVHWKSDLDGDEKGSVKLHGRQVLLASLKAGGVGLNLTSASFLFLMDSWWNPAVEEQGMQRVHRIGQNLPVIIFKLYVRNSIEERILELHKRKDYRARSVLGENKAISRQPKATSAWNLEDMKKLFSL